MSRITKAVSHLPLMQTARSLRSQWIRRGQFRREFTAFQAMSESVQPRFALRWQDRYPCLDDKTGMTSFDHHYVYHTAWAARIVALNRPVDHVDISSSVYFCALVSAFVPVRYYDYRPADLHLNNLSSERADLLALPFADSTILSLSCLHVVEHVGLGRYGDPLDPGGDLKAMAELKRVLAPGGSLLFVVPVGRPHICFNAHRIYDPQQILEYFDDLELVEFSAVDDQGDPAWDTRPEEIGNARYGCGLFWFRKH